MKTDPRATTGRAFVRSLNILLKFARLYGYEHVRTTQQLQVAWNELQAAIPQGSENGLLLGATGSQLLLDGVPLEGSPAEKQFAQLLSAAGLASIQFHPCVTEQELVSFTHAFPTGKAKPAELAQQMKEALASAHGIHLNEICFVATDSRLKDASMAAQIAAASLGDSQDSFKKMLNDPQKLLELIAAAEGSKSGGAGEGAGGGAGEGMGGGTGSGASESRGGGAHPGVAELASGASGRGSGAGAGHGAGLGPGLGAGREVGRATGFGGGFGAGRGAGPGTGSGFGSEPSDAQIVGILRALSAFGNVGRTRNVAAATVEFQDQVNKLPVTSQAVLRNALAEMAEQGKNKKLDQGVLVQLAEHLAIRFALEQFDRGEVKVNAVKQMLDRLNQEIDALRQILGEHENKMTDAGLMVESHREILDRQFWANIPESAKREVLLSNEAWCIPPKNVQSYVAHLIEQGDIADANSILENYARCADSEDTDARKRAATGLSELAELYAKTNPKLLSEALRHVGLRLSVEQDQDLQSLVSAAFVRLCQEAAAKRHFGAMAQAQGSKDRYFQADQDDVSPF